VGLSHLLAAPRRFVQVLASVWHIRPSTPSHLLSGGLAAAQAEMHFDAASTGGLGCCSYTSRSQTKLENAITESAASKQRETAMLEHVIHAITGVTLERARERAVRV